MRLRFATPKFLAGVLLLTASACASSLTTTPAPPATTATSAAPGTNAVAPPPTTATSSTAPSVSTSSASTPSPSVGAAVSGAASARRWFEVVEALVREVKPTPPEAARLYAYAATAYADALDAGATAAQAGHAVVTIVSAVRPASASAFASAMSTAGVDPGADDGPAAVTSAVDRLVARVQSDGFATASVPTEPAGEGLWRAADGKPPLSPAAGAWQLWLVDEALFTAPPPPAPASAEQRAQLAAVKRAVAARDARWVNRINFWGGAPGTNTPSGIWQDVLADELHGSPAAADDLVYAHLQSDLARTLADAFIETWRVKFTYWSARPDMVDPTVSTAMPDPRFPGYVSGHSAVSAAAATLLGVLVPAKVNVWFADAEEARDSRLMAGIHFPVDNDEGFALGRQVGRAASVALRFRPDVVASTGNLEPRPSRLAVPAGVLADPSGSSASDLDASEDARPADGTLPIVSTAHSPGGHDGSGVLMRLSHAGYDRNLLLVADKATAPRFVPEAGWALETMSSDAMWTPSACGGSPTVLVGDRWIVYIEAVEPEDDGSYRMRLVSFDLVTHRFTSYLPTRNDVSYSGSFLGSSSHSVDIGYDLGPTGEPLRVRRIDLRDGAYRDRRYVAARSSQDGAVDGIRADGRAPDGGDVTYVRPDGGVHARIHAYREPNPIAWSGPYGYLQALDGPGADDPGRFDVGVYDVRTATWDWAFQHLRGDASFLVLGAMRA